jgi:hypothetical protein
MPFFVLLFRVDIDLVDKYPALVCGDDKLYISCRNASVKQNTAGEKLLQIGACVCVEAVV